MRAVSVDVLLGLAIIAAWIAAVAFMRLKWSLDRLHVVAFVTIGCGLPIVLAGFVADGASTRAFKLLFLWGVALIGGAALNQAVGRAIFNRSEAGERT